MNKKIQKALNKKELIDFDEIFAGYSKRRKDKILKKARYLKLAMALRKIRQRLKLSQQKLAQKMNVKREFIARIESGRQNVTLETLYKIGEAIGKKPLVVFR